MIRNMLITIVLTITLLGDNATETTPQYMKDVEKIKSMINGIDTEQIYGSGKTYLDSINTLENQQKAVDIYNTYKQKISEYAQQQIAQAAQKHFNIKQAQSVTYEVKVTKDNNITGSGTAVAISSDGKLITAYHNIETYKNIKVIDNNSKEYAVRVGNISVDNDLAYLHIDAINIPFAKLSNELELGKDIYMLSYENLLLTGIVSQIKPNGVVLNVEAKRGTSGGGIFNEKNELVAVLLRKDVVDKTSFAANTNMFTTITQKYKAKEELLNLYSNNYDYSFCEDEDELIIWNKYSKSQNPRIQEYHALFLGLCEKVKNRDLTTEHAQFIFEHAKIRLFGN